MSAQSPLHPFNAFWRAFAVALLLVLLLVSCRAELGPGDARWERLVADHRHDADMGTYRMHYIDIGSGHPVVMIHGFASSSYCWYRNARTLLDAGHRLVLVDLPGCGRSEIPPEELTLSVNYLAAEVMKLVDMLEIERFSVAGSSMGGGIALYLAIQHPNRVQRVVLVDPACFPHKPPALLGLLQSPELGDLMAKFIGRTTIRYSLKSTYYDKSKVSEIMVDEYTRPALKPGYGRFLMRLMRQFEPPDKERLVERYATIQTPVLIFWGDKDKWIPPKLGVRLQKTVPGSRLVTIKDAGHMPHQEQADIVNPLLADFLSLSSGRSAKVQ